jgi:ribonuclease HI
MITLYTDGSSRGNPGPGGFGVVLMFKQHRKEMSEGFRFTTNNRMELLAVITGLEALKEPGHEVVIYSDSKYVIDSVEKGWVLGWVKKNFKDKKNEDLWRRYLYVSSKHKIRIN